MGRARNSVIDLDSNFGWKVQEIREGSSHDGCLIIILCGFTIGSCARNVFGFDILRVVHVGADIAELVMNVFSVRILLRFGIPKSAESVLICGNEESFEGRRESM